MDGMPHKRQGGVAPEISQQRKPPSSVAKADIVIVDDDVPACKLLAKVLGSYGYALSCVHDGPTAVARIWQKLPDLVILDVLMPDVDGWQVLQRLRQDKSTWNLPIVMFSALSDPVYRDKAVTLGANDFWVKSQMDGEQMKNRIARILENSDRYLSRLLAGTSKP
jgi:PleD family two-component response regulator